MNKKNEDKFDILIIFLIFSTLILGLFFITTSSFLVVGGFKFMLAMLGNI